MRKDEVLKLLAQHKPELIRRFGITDLALFGSTARDAAQEGSEINWQQYIGAHNRLIHDYWRINNDIVWGIIQDEIPVLIKQLHSLKKAADENQIR